MWERYSGLIRLVLELPLFGFFNLTSISSGALFQARDIMLRKQKSRPPCYRRTAEKSVLRGSALFEKEKAGILMALLRHKNPG